MRFISLSTLFLSSLVLASPSLRRRQLARGLPVNPSSSTPAASPTASGGAQTSLTLLTSLIAPNFAQNGLATNTSEPGVEVASLTSTNNFINWCATLPDLPITNGEQLQNGSCNPAPMGAIPSTKHMPSVKFVTPINLAVIPPNTTFLITLAVKNLVTGYFANPATNYYAAPQQLDPTTHLIQGHVHVVIQSLHSLHQTTPTDPTKFAFFTALNVKADAKGYLYTNVTGGLPKGVYRLSSIAAATNHQPVSLPVAQRGTADDAIYFTVGGEEPITNTAHPHHSYPATTHTPIPTQTATETC